MPEHKLPNVTDIADDAISIPAYCRGKFIVTRISPPKDKSPTDGKLVRMIMTEFIDIEGDDEDPKPTKMVVANKLEDGSYDIEFPFGKTGLFAMQYAGRYGYKFQVDGNWKSVTEKHYSKGFFIKNVLPKYPEYEKMSDTEIADAYEEYCDMLFDSRLEQSFLTDTAPKVGWVTEFYRRYVPPKDGEKYGNTYFNKYAPKDKNLEPISGDYKEVDVELALAIDREFNKKEDDSSFDYGANKHTEDDDMI